MKKTILLILILGLNFNGYSQTENQELSNMRLYRNEIFARQGMEFKSKDLIEYFNQKKWYKPKKDFNIKSLSCKEIIAANTIKQIEELYPDFNEYDKKTAKELFQFIQDYTYKKINLTKFTIADFDNIIGKDTITTIATEKETGGFVVEYKFIRNKEKLWSKTLQNPLFQIGEHKIFDNYENYYFNGFMAAKLCKAISQTMWNLPLEDSVLNIGLNSIERKGGISSLDDYELYLMKFDNELLSIDLDESGGELYIWYEPIKTFIKFFNS